MKGHLGHFLPVSLVLLIPLLTSISSFATFVVTLIMLNCILAISFNLMAGYAGLFNLAIGALAGFGGYTSAYLVTQVGASFWMALPVSGLVSAGIGVALGYPSVRIKGLYFAITTLMIQILLTQLFVEWIGFTRGDVGVSSVPSPVISVGQYSIRITGTSYAYLVLLLLLGWLFVARRLAHGSVGLKLVSIRDDEVLASYLGINVTRERLKIFFLSSFMAGVYGSLLVHLTTFLSPRVVDIFLSINVLVMVLVGGLGTFWGSILGAILLTALPNGLVFIYPFRNYINGLLLIIIMLFSPKGLAGLLSKFLERRSI